MQKHSIQSTFLILAVASLATLLIAQAPIQSFADVPSPKKQTQIGIDQTDIICKANMIKVYRINADSIDCFTLSTVQKLDDRGLIKDIPQDKLELKKSFRQNEPLGTITKIATLNQFGEEGKFSSTHRIVEYLHVFEVCAKDKNIRAPEILISSDSEAKAVKLAQKINAEKCYTTSAKIKATDPSSISTVLTNKGMITDKLMGLEQKITDIKEKISQAKKNLGSTLKDNTSTTDENNKEETISASDEIIQLRKELNSAKGELNKYLFALHAPSQIKASEFTKQKLTFTGVPLGNTSTNILTITEQVMGSKSQGSAMSDIKTYNVVFEACTDKEGLRVPEVKVTSDSDDKIVRIAEKIIANSCQMSTVKVNAVDSNSINLIIADRSDISSNILDLEKEIERLTAEQVKHQMELNKLVVQSEKDADYEKRVAELSENIIELRNEIKDVKFRLYGSIYEVYRNS